MTDQGGLFDSVMKADELGTLAQKYQGTYRYSGVGRCRFCQAKILWFTTPKGRHLAVHKRKQDQVNP